MAWNNDEDSLVEMDERGFTIETQGRTVPGVYWHPKAASTNRLVMLGHGGTAHKKVDYLVGVAQLLARHGISSMAIDGPGHGERSFADITPGPETFATMWNRGGGHDGMLADWRGALDFIEREFGSRPTGWWGLSMGTMMGLPVTATDDRVKIALFGLMGAAPPNPDGMRFMELAPKVTCPVRFLVQWDDEIVPRDSCLDLFSALGTSKKTLHGNPGRHQDVPQFEIVSSVDYLDKHLS